MFKLQIIIIFSVFLLGCIGGNSLEIPRAKEIKEISITHYEDENEFKRVIKEESRIIKLISFIDNNNSNWQRNWHTMPVPKYYASAINQNDTVVALFYIGESWVAVQFGSPSVKNNSFYYWEISDENKTKFKQLLGIGI